MTKIKYWCKIQILQTWRYISRRQQIIWRNRSFWKHKANRKCRLTGSQSSQKQDQRDKTHLRYVMCHTEEHHLAQLKAWKVMHHYKRICVRCTNKLTMSSVIPSKSIKFSTGVMENLRPVWMISNKNLAILQLERTLLSNLSNVKK